MSLEEKRKKRVYRTLFFTSFLLLLAVSYFYMKEYSSKDTPNIDEELISLIQLKELESEVLILEKLKAVDNQLLFEDNYKSTLLDLEKFLDETNENKKFKEEIKNRIQYTKNLIEDQKEDELSGINLRNQIVRQDKIIDSLRKKQDSITVSLNQNQLINQRKIDSLNSLLKKKNELLNLKETVKVISFKNKNGNTIRYLGETKNDQANGNGIGIWNTGSIYRGEWENNLRHGLGEFEWNDGQKYEGGFVEGERTGDGTYYWPSGEKYIGEFKNNKRHGKGVFYDPDGNVKFDGDWKNDKYQGK